MHSATTTDLAKGDATPSAGDASGAAPMRDILLATHKSATSEGTFSGTLLGRLEAFLTAWQGGDGPPSLRQFLPAAPREANRDALVQFVLADLDFRYRTGCPKRVEEYVQEFPELAAEDGVPCELIFEEFQVRRTSGERVDTAEYARRFPERAVELEAWFSLAAPTVNPTVMGGVKRVLQVQIGQTVDDFQLLSLLGEGAFGRVFLARQISMHRLVALKVSADRGAEHQTLANLDHPHIVRVYDQRRLPERGLRLLYMQYVAGGTLHEVVRRVRETPPDRRCGSLLLAAVDEAVERGGQPPMSFSPERRRLADASWPEVVCLLGAQLAQALHYAHKRGVLHRDVKPANVLLATDGSPKLADFNVSSNSQLEDSPSAAYFGGSLAYMSPEQLAACHPGLPTHPEDLDERCDLYSLGVVLWELLHGERPFDDRMQHAGFEATLDAMIAARRAGPPARLGVSNDPLLEVLDGVLQRCLAPNPNDRFPSAQRLARELRLCLNARAREILQAPPRGWRRWAQRYPMLAGMVVGYASHAVVATVAVVYLYYAIIHKMPPAQQQRWTSLLGVAAVVGALAGIAAVWIFGRRVVAAIQSPLGQVHAPEHMTAVRHEALNLAPRAAFIAAHNWTVSGIICVIYATLIGGLGVKDCLNILGCHIVGGCIALVYPVLGGALVTIRAYYPALVARSPGEPNDGPQLARLSRLIEWVVPFAGFIPFFAVLWFALRLDDLVGAPRIIAVLSLGIAGCLAIPLAWRMSGAIQSDLHALIQATSGNPTQESDSQRA